MTLQEAFEAFEEHVKPAVIQQYGADDDCALSEAWNDYTDQLNQDGELTELQRFHCPAYGDAMPNDDFEFITSELGITSTRDEVIAANELLDELTEDEIRDLKQLA